MSGDGKKERTAEAKRVSRKCFGSLMILSLAELLNFSAFITLEGLQSNVNAEVGMIALGLLYLAFLLSSMFLPALVLDRLDCRKTLALSTVTYACYTAANFYPVAYTMIPAAVLLGVGAALLWSALRVYISKIARWYAEARDEDVGQTTSSFFGIFFTIFSLSLVIGNVITSVLTALATEEDVGPESINNGTTTVALPVNASSSTASDEEEKVCGIYFNGTNDASEGLDPHQFSLILVVFLVMQALSTALCFLLHERPPQPSSSFSAEEQLQLRESDEKDGGKDASSSTSALKLARITFKLLRRDKPAWLLVLMTMRLGFFWSFVMGQFTQAWIGCAIGIVHVTRCMAVFGAAMAASSLLSGQLTKLLPVDIIILVAAACENAVLLALLVWVPDGALAWPYYALAGAMALTNGIIKSQTPSVYAMIWTEGDEVAASSALQSLWESGASCLLYGLSGFLYPVSQLVLVLVSLNLGTATLLWAWRIRDRASRFF